MRTDRRYKRNKRVDLVSVNGNPIQVFQKDLKDFAKHIAEGNFSELHMKVTDEEIQFDYKTRTGKGKLTFKDIKNK